MYFYDENTENEKPHKKPSHVKWLENGGPGFEPGHAASRATLLTLY